MVTEFRFTVKAQILGDYSWKLDVGVLGLKLTYMGLWLDLICTVRDYS